MAVFLSNVSDYIEPSMNCVNPLKIGEGSDSGSVQNSGYTSNDKVKKKQQKVSLSYEGQAAPKPVVASITLSDCLACSGCITSTESVLVDAQSTSSLEDAVGRGDRVCFMLSASSVVELQRHWETVAGKDLGRRAVSAFVRERLREFSEGRCVILSSDNSSVRRIWADASYDEFLVRFDGGSGPVLAGHCPGLVCYAEKSAHDLVDTLSAIRSPTMISAKLARGAFGEGRAFLTAVEPCYDKKLEVTRSDYRDEAAKLNDVDLVLTSSELRKLVERGVPDVLKRIEELQDLEVSDDGTVPPELDSLSLERACFLGQSPLGSGSGGLAELMLRRFAAERYGLTEWLDFKLAVPWGRETSGVRRRKRGTDGVLEAWICERTGGEAFVSGPENGDVAEPGSYTVLHRFALAYGWKAIQIITMSLRKYAYIEAMACPHGCVNGGGGVKVTEDDEYAPKETSAEIKARVTKARRIVTDEWGSEKLDEPVKADVPLTTSYTKVEALELRGGNVDGVKHAETLW